MILHRSKAFLILLTMLAVLDPFDFTQVESAYKSHDRTARVLDPCDFTQVESKYAYQIPFLQVLEPCDFTQVESIQLKLLIMQRECFRQLRTRPFVIKADFAA